MALDIPLPTASPQDDPEQYIPLLLSAIEGFLLARDVWEVEDYADARQYMNALMEYVVEVMRGDIVRLPIGHISEFGGSTIPAKFLLCDGQEISRTTYADLFSVIGTIYGVGNGTTTFNVPDFRDRSPMMPGTGNVDGLGVEWGVSAVQLTIGQLPNHDHDFAEVGHTHPPNGAAVFQGSNAGGSTGFEVDIAGQTRVQMTTTGSALSGITFHAQGSNLYHENMHPVLGVNILIFAGV